MTAAGSGPATTPLGRHLAARIKAEGPIPLDQFMHACLLDPMHGYYRKRPAIGASGDFITAPEISQVFGELLGLWAAVAWERMGRPRPVHLIELGPGRGTLMADALRALRAVPEMMSALQVHLIEANATLAAIQRETLATLPLTITWPQAWEIPDGASILLANEFLDAIPVRQLVQREGRWHERCVGLEGAAGFRFEPGRETTPPIGIAAAADGAIAEVRDWSYSGQPMALMARLARSGPSAMLFVDYGHEGAAAGETLQAVRGHSYESPLDHPGQADLSAHVEFAAFRRAAAGLGLDGTASIPQAAFLASLGIVERAERLIRGASPRIANTLEHGIARLLEPQGMGTRFRAMALTSRGLAPPPGFEASAGRT